jgi:hypothetical protein
MRNKKLISRVLVFMLALILTFTFIPPNLLIAFADDYSDTGSANVSVSGGSEYADEYNIGGWEYGIRIYCITKNDDGTYSIKPGKTGTSVIDLWHANEYDGRTGVDILNTYYPYSVYSNGCRFGAVAPETILTTTFDAGVNTATNNLRAHGYLKSTESIGSIPNFSGFVGSSFSMKGDDFRTWAQTKAGGYWQVVLLYYGLTGTGISDNDFLVMEPMLSLPVIVGPWTNMWYQYHSASTWYDYMARLGDDADNSGGTMMNVKVAWGNGFKLSENMAGLTAPGDCSTTTRLKGIGTNGWGLHILKSDPFDDESTPIDTFDIISNKANDPKNAEEPKDDNNTTGEKNIIKLYVDLYRDPKTGYYTQIVDTAQFSRTKTSDKITITDEQNINGYKVAAWYTSSAAYSSLPKGSSMLDTVNMGVTDGAVKLSQLGGTQIRINTYTTATGYTSANKQKYYAALPGKGSYLYGHGTSGNGVPVQKTTNAKNYTDYKRLAVSGTSYYGSGSYSYAINDGDKATYVELGDGEKTLVVLYTREMSYIKTTATSVTTNNNKTKDNSGNLTIVKLYGTINPSTYEIEDITSKVIKNTTRNVRILNESGYNFTEWIYLTGGASTSLKASQMGNPNNCTFPNAIDKSADQTSVINTDKTKVASYKDVNPLFIPHIKSR